VESLEVSEKEGPKENFEDQKQHMRGTRESLQLFDPPLLRFKKMSARKTGRPKEAIQFRN